MFFFNLFTFVVPLFTTIVLFFLVSCCFIYCLFIFYFYLCLCCLLIVFLRNKLTQKTSKNKNLICPLFLFTKFFFKNSKGSKPTKKMNSYYNPYYLFTIIFSKSWIQFFGDLIEIVYYAAFGTMHNVLKYL